MSASALLRCYVNELAGKFASELNLVMKCKLLLVAVAALFLVAAECDAASYLFYMPFVSKSMKITFMPMASELAARGHEVTVVMPYASKEQTKGIKEIIIDYDFQRLTAQISKVALNDGGRKPPPIFEMVSGAIEANDHALSHPDMQVLLKNKNTKFDVVLTSCFLANDAGYYLAHRFNAELALYFTAQTAFSTMDFALGQPHNPSYMPIVVFPFTHPMSFLERVANTVATYAFHYVIRDYYILGKVSALLDKHFPEDTNRPDLVSLERNASLGISFGHPLLMDGLRPVSPNFVFVGMMNCRAPQPLPADLDAFMKSGSKDGVIYVSFGSVLHASMMSEAKRKIFINVFKRLKQKVIWKWETEHMDDMPDNLKLSKWLPQQDILGHPNTKLFISHSGQSSFQESLCHKKPVLSIPVEGDQHANSRETVKLEIGLGIPFYELTEEQLYNNIMELLDNPRYENNAKKLGTLILDQETKPLSRATWWLEYVARNPGTHFRSPVHDMAWHQFYLLDVFAFLLVVLVIVFWISAKCCCFAYRKCRGKPAASSSKKRN